MSTRGAITFTAGGVRKTTYNHSDSYPTWLGVNIVSWIRSPEFDLASVRAKVTALRMVDESGSPTAEDIELAWVAAAYGNPGVSTGSDWYAILRGTQGDPAAILAAGLATDAADFAASDDCWCEWRYVIDLDSETLGICGTADVSLTFADLRASEVTSEVMMDALENPRQSTATAANGYTVMVKWAKAKRAERLANGTTTTRKLHAVSFATREDASLAAQVALDGIAGIERWWVAPF